MKKTAVIGFVCWLAVACTKNSTFHTSLTGRWQLTAIFLQTTGIGSWYSEDSIPPDYVQFNGDGSLNMSPYVSTLFGSPTGYEIANDSTILMHYPAPSATNNFYQANHFYFRLADSVLLMYPPDMELAIEKFKKVQPAASQ